MGYFRKSTLLRLAFSPHVGKMVATVPSITTSCDDIQREEDVCGYVYECVLGKNGEGNSHCTSFLCYENVTISIGSQQTFPQKK